MNFKHKFTWSYDFFGILSKMRIEQKYAPYIHTSRPELKQFMNQEEWKENTLQEVEEKNLYSSQTPLT